MSTTSTREKWYKKLANSPHALVLLFFLSALEATVLPIPLELILVPYMVLERERIWLIASVALAGFMAGSVGGYYIGYALFDTIGQWFIDYLSVQEQYGEFQSALENNGFWSIFLVGVTPVPFQVAMLAAGAGKYPLALFLLAAGIARALRYYILAALVFWLGPQAEDIWKRYSGPAGWSILIAAVSVILLIQFL